MNRLMDCPFCGGSDIGIKEVSNTKNGHIYAVVCKKCNSTVFGDISKSDTVAQSYARSRWNLRTYRVPIKEIVKEVPTETPSKPQETVNDKAQPKPKGCNDMVWTKFNEKDESTYPQTSDKLLLVGVTGATFIGYFEIHHGKPGFYRSKNDPRKATHWSYIPKVPKE